MSPQQYRVTPRSIRCAKFGLLKLAFIFLNFFTESFQQNGEQARLEPTGPVERHRSGYQSGEIRCPRRQQSGSGQQADADRPPVPLLHPRLVPQLSRPQSARPNASR